MSSAQPAFHINELCLIAEIQQHLQAPGPDIVGNTHTTTNMSVRSPEQQERDLIDVYWEPGGQNSSSSSSSSNDNQNEQTHRLAYPLPKKSISPVKATNVLEPEKPSVQVAAPIPPAKNKARAGLRWRDEKAVEYSQSLLLEGDTLVFIDYHGSGELWHAEGFKLSTTPRRVHSANLRKINSPVFEKMLSPKKQERVIRRRNLEHRLPSGIQYVLDLTPPVEGEEAADLITQLSCSLGIRAWGETAKHQRIRGSLVDGHDEFVAITKKRSSSTQLSEDIVSDSNEKEKESEPVVVDGDMSEPKAKKQAIEELKPAEKGQNEEDCLEGIDEDLKNAIQRTMGRAEPVEETIMMSKALERSMTTEEKSPEDNSPEPPPSLTYSEDYSIPRHIAGIEMLLKIIEDRNIVVDSAPKLWTLVVLAEYFQCPNLVVDRVISWILEDRNSCFVEILPEAALRIGTALRIPMLTRAAYSILVSERALAIAAAQRGALIPSKISPFYRPKEELDEDMETCVQYASNAFHERITRNFEALVEKNMNWLDTLPEFVRLMDLEQKLPLKNFSNHWSLQVEWKLMQLKHILRDYVRGQILMAVTKPLVNVEAAAFSSHLLALQWQAHDGLDEPPAFDGASLWKAMSLQERAFTTHFWTCVRLLKFQRSRDLDVPEMCATPSNEIIEEYGIRPISMYGIVNADESFHQAIWNAIDDAADRRKSTASTTADSDNTHPLKSDRSPKIPISSLIIDDSMPDEPQPPSPSTSTSASSSTSASNSPKLSRRKFGEKGNRPRHFDCNKLLGEIERYLERLSSFMLDSSELCIERSVTDLILSLGPDEIQFLPLWAGGNDDGTGGVTQSIIPPATIGPNGPGPAFHTGELSASSSRTSSEFDMVSEGNTSLYHTSVAVNDGYSDYQDRRRVISDDGMSSSGFSEDSEVYGYSYTPSVRSVDSTNAVEGFRNMNLASDSDSEGSSMEEVEDFEMTDRNQDDDNSDSDDTIKLDNDFSDDDDNWDGFEDMDDINE